jgi:hypothetical protein
VNICSLNWIARYGVKVVEAKRLLLWQIDGFKGLPFTFLVLANDGGVKLMPSAANHSSIKF